MNHGMMKEFVSESAGMIVSMRIGRMVSNFLRTELSQRTGKASKEEIKEMIENYLKTSITPEVASEFRREAMQKVLADTGVGEQALGSYKLPMVELSDVNLAGFKKVHEDIKAEFSEMIYGEGARFSKATNSGDDDYIKRVLGDIRKLEAYKPAQVAQVNDAIVQKANQARKIQLAKDEHRFLQMYDKMTHLIKLNMTTVVPSFHMRNLVANTYLTWLNIGRDAFDVKLHKKAFQVVRNSGQKVDADVLTYKLPNGEIHAMPWTEVWNEAKSLGVVDEGFFAKDIGASAKTSGVIPKLPGKFDPTDSENFLLYKYGGKIGNAIENTSRLVHFVALLKSGVEAREAARQVKEFLFDYSDLTRFEQTVMKRLIPFYTWIRKNGALQLDSLIERTERVQLVAKTFNGIEGMNNEEDMIDARYLSNFAEDWIQTPFSAENAFGNREPILWSPNLPINDLSRIPDPFNLRRTLENLFTQGNAIFKAPIEQVANKQVFFDSPITEEGDAAGEQIAKRANHLASHNALYNTLKAFFTKEGVDGHLNLLATTTGVKFATYDVEGYIRNHLMKEGQRTDVGIGELGEFIGTQISQATSNIASRISSTRPKPADAYTGALRPLSVESYNSLPESEKRLYEPPTFTQAYALNLRAKELEKEAYNKAGVLSKFVWAVFDGVGKQEFEIGNVERVVDGDTFDVRVGEGIKTIRMLLVDTPETVKPGVEPQPFGVEASNYSKRRLMDKDVKIVFDGSKTDSYGRTLAYVEIPESGVDYNRELIESGLGVKGYEFQDSYDRGREYDRASQSAQEAERGVYSVPGYAQGAGNFDLEAYKRYLNRFNSN
jgi:endonuclease YncB( thermonuclease family)